MAIPMGFARRFLQTSIGQMVYFTQDTDRPETLVFLHGFGGGSSSFEWSLVYPYFTAGYRVVAPDLIGWGESYHLERDYQPDDYLRSLREFLEQQAGVVTVVASSVVAAWVVRLAAEFPQLIQRLVLMCPTGLSDFGEPYKNPFFQVVAAVPGVNWLFYQQGVANRGTIRYFLEERLFARKERVTNEMVEAYYASASQPQAEFSAFSFLKGDLCFDLALWLPRLQTPTAIFWGERAQFAGPKLGQRLAQLSEQVRVFTVIPDTGTTPQLERPALVCAQLTQALPKLL
ncbi:alpha/beta fold hydrolase [Candidatus Cyanaurora vandensis]|uniref:alpha/beta fold hydrolase n=1 Tax=Candidatus Cyanaurora vandensis TaxID=2714958 RepID=UPI00257C275D|nr:alpha/beta hydrolase [Candidatus Cyanaurora vandensis]